MRKPFFWIVAIGVLYALHQDLWFWESARPLVFGFLPVGLAYHALYCLAAAGLMWALTRYAWPAHLHPDPSSTPSEAAPQNRPVSPVIDTRLRLARPGFLQPGNGGPSHARENTPATPNATPADEARRR